MQALTRVAIYCRISEDDAGDALGVGRQEQDCRERVDRTEDWELYKVYVDNDISASAKANRERPDWNALVAAAERDEFDLILATRTNRLTRDVVEKESLIALCRRTAIRVCTLMDGEENYETESGRTSSRIRGVIAAGEAERISENVKRAVRQRVERGRVHGGQRPFGWGAETGKTYYRKGEDRPIYDTTKRREPEFSALREGILAVTGGASIRSVAKAWDDAGLFTSGGKPWITRLTSVRNVLTRWRNAGVRVYQGEPLFDALPACEPVVTREELEALHDHLADRSRRTNRGRVAQSALVGSLASCGVCGGPLTSATAERSHVDRTRVGTYRCKIGCVTIRRVILDEMVINAVLVELMSSDLTLVADSAEDRAQLRWLRLKRADLEAEANQLAVDHVEKVITRSQFIAANAALQRHAAATEHAWDELRARFVLADWIERDKEILELSDQDRDTATAAELSRFEGLPLHRRREIIGRLFRSITVNRVWADDRVVITTRGPVPRRLAHPWQSKVTIIEGEPPASSGADES